MTPSRFAVGATFAIAVLITVTLRAQTERPKLVAPVRGEARIGHLPPVTKLSGTDIVTVFQIKNLSNAPIAGLRIEEFWYDKTNNLVPGSREVVRKPIQPGEVVTVTLRTPKDVRMSRSQYRFSHANGTVKPETLKTLK